MLKVVFAALLSVSVVGAGVSFAEAAPRHKHYSKKYKRSGKSSSSYDSYYRTQRSYYTCGYSRC
jgi:hypothetical protein